MWDESLHLAGELIDQRLDRQRRATLRAVIHKDVGPAVLTGGLADEPNDVAAHRRHWSYQRLVGRRGLDRIGIGHAQRRQYAKHGKRRRKALPEPGVLL